MGRSLASGSLGDPVGGEHCHAAAQWDRSCQWPVREEQKTAHSPAASPGLPAMARSIILEPCSF